MTAHLLAPFRSLAAVDPTVVECPPDEGLMGTVLGRLQELDGSDVDWYLDQARPGGGPVADLMSGRGRVGRALARRGMAVTCVDASPDVVADGTRGDEGIAFVLADVAGDEPPLPPGGMAGAVCTGRSVSLLDQAGRRTLFGHAARLLASGGWFLCDAFERFDASSGPDVEIVPLAPVHDGLLWCAARVDAACGVMTTNFLLEPAAAGGLRPHRLLASQSHHGAAAADLDRELRDAGFGRVRVERRAAPDPSRPGYLRVAARL